MIRIPLLLLALFLALGASHPALAHRVNIFAWPDGDSIAVECAFNRGSPVKGGEIIVHDVADGAEILRGRTDDRGEFRFPIPERMRRGHGLRIVILAGEGHRNEWLMEASEAAASASASATEAVAPEPGVSAAPAPEADDDPIRAATPEDVRRIVNAALEASLAPLRRELAARNAAGPSLRDVIGGVGWILGLAGIAAYFRRRQ